MPNLIANYLTVDPVTGAVGANFSGHVHAAGLDLDASPIGLPLPEDEIRWLKQSDGSLVAEMVGITGPTLGRLDLRAHSPADETAALYLIAIDSAQEIFVELGPALAPTPTRLVLDEQGQSDYLQKGSPGKSQVGDFNATFAGVLATTDFVINHAFNVAGVRGFAIGRAGGTLGTFCTGEIISSTVNTATIRTRTIDGSVPAAAATKTMCYMLWTP